MNERNKWGECGKIAKILGCTKNDVFYKLYDDLFDHGLIIDILMGHDKAIAKAKNLESWKQLTESKKPAETDGERIKIALWFIDKVGGVDYAHKSIKAAGKLLEVMQA